MTAAADADTADHHLKPSAVGRPRHWGQ